MLGKYHANNTHTHTTSSLFVAVNERISPVMHFTVRSSFIRQPDQCIDEDVLLGHMQSVRWVGSFSRCFVSVRCLLRVACSAIKVTHSTNARAAQRSSCLHIYRSLRWYICTCSLYCAQDLCSAIINQATRCKSFACICFGMCCLCVCEQKSLLCHLCASLCVHDKRPSSDRTSTWMPGGIVRPQKYNHTTTSATLVELV